MKPASDLTLCSAPGVASRIDSRVMPPREQAARDEAAPSRLVDFYELTKPRMNFLVVLTMLVGYMLAAPRGGMNWILLVSALFGTMMCAASAATLNQLFERRLDARMPRTRNRPLATGRIGIAEAAVFGAALGIAGVALLARTTNLLTAALGLVTIVWYLALYTPAKRWTTLNTVIGAVPGAIPPLMGFTAAQNWISPAAAALFGILFFWQMPHFLAIAVMYRDDYRLGGFKMLPCEERDASMPITGRMMVLYAAALIPVSLMPTLLGVCGDYYFVIALLLGAIFLRFAIVSAAGRGDRRAARKLFFASIIYLPLLLAAMLIDKA